MTNFDYINFQDITGSTLLMQSVAKNDIDNVKELIKLGSNINHENLNNDNILTLALKLEDKTLIHTIFPNIEKYTHQKFSSKLINSLYANLTHEDTKILLLYPFDLTLSNAIRNSDYELTKVLLEKGVVFDFEAFSYLNTMTREKKWVEFLELFEQFGLNKKDERFTSHSLKLCPKQVVWNYLINNDYTVNISIFDKLGQIEIGQKEFKALFLNKLNEKTYKEVDLWELEHLRIHNLNPVFEFVNYVIEKNWDINFENDSDKQKCGNGHIFYMIDQLYSYSLQFKNKNQEYENVRYDKLNQLYKILLEKADLNQKPFGNPLYFEAFHNLLLFKEQIPILDKLDFSLIDYSGENNILNHLLERSDAQFSKNFGEIFLKELSLFHELLDKYQFNVDEKNKHGQSFFTNILSFFLRSTGINFNDDKFKPYKNQITDLLLKIIDTQNIDLNQKIGSENLSIQETLDKVKSTKDKLLTEKIYMQLSIKPTKNSSKKIKI
jgi:hypothetical protein